MAGEQFNDKPSLEMGKAGSTKAKTEKPTPIEKKPVTKPVVTPHEDTKPAEDSNVKNEIYREETRETPTIQDKTKPEVEGNGDGGDEGSDEETVLLGGANSNSSLSAYLNGIRFKIEGVWRYPDAARRSALQGHGLAGFIILRDGTILDVRIISSSGYPVLDEAILKAIRDAAPFDPFTKIKKNRLNLIVPFDYTMGMTRFKER